MMIKKRVYLDHAATTPLDPRVKKAMDRFWIEDFANPGGIYEEGMKINKEIDLARESVAKVIGARSKEIIFTSGGTESDNLAILGVATLLGSSTPKLKKGHIVTTKIEHPAVLEPCRFLEKNGFDITYLDVGEGGIIDSQDVKKALRKDTILVSVMYANNEIGTIQPIREIAKVLRDFKRKKLKIDEKFPVFHTDACQASGYLDLDVNKLGVDLMTINGSKIYGPKGVGMLYVRKGVEVQPIIYGGGQEKGKRSGTENVPGIIGLAEALKIANKQKDKETVRLTKLRDFLIKKILKEIPRVYLNGDAKKRLPNNVNFSVMGVEGEALVLYLNEEGIACSTGSACSSKNLDPSHVIMALGKPSEYAHGSLRFTLGRKTSKMDIEYVVKVLPRVVKKLRSFSAVE